ncbi:MAG: flagellar hook capping protein [Lachnospiraceae bacterium]|nr:flagellar hook capping protein [Lachnospiraceae bacterium]
MSVSAIVDQGKVTNLTDESSSKNTSADSVNKDQFLQLLVAQMKYQDPLQPTDNTEYVSQLANFSELEQMQNLVASTESQRAYGLVGSLVTVTHTDESTGATTEVTGKVDSVIKSGTTVKLSINDQYYDLDDVTQVYDTNYADAQALSSEFATAYNALPALTNLTAANAETYKSQVQTLSDTYNEMSIYQRTFLAVDTVNGLKSYIERMADYGIEIKDNAFGITAKTTSGSQDTSTGTGSSTETGSSTGTGNSTDTGTSTGTA